MAEPWGCVTWLAERLGLTTAEFWTLVPQIAIASGAILAGFNLLSQRGKDRVVRKEELAWRRTELINEFAQQFDNGPDYKRALAALVEFRHGRKPPDLRRVLGPNAHPLSRHELELRYAFDRYLDFFDRLYTYVHLTKVIQVRELLFFSAYVDEIRDIRPLRTYAEECGYGVVIRLADDLDAERLRVNALGGGKPGGSRKSLIAGLKGERPITYLPVDPPS